jgi:hypothetical protein
MKRPATVFLARSMAKEWGRHGRVVRGICRAGADVDPVQEKMKYEATRVIQRCARDSSIACALGSSLSWMGTSATTQRLQTSFSVLSMHLQCTMQKLALCVLTEPLVFAAPLAADNGLYRLMF